MGITQKVGSLGEELTVKFLVKRGYRILDRNYWRPWGELDIVAEKKGRIHFVEVKAKSAQIVSDETPAVKPRGLGLLRDKQNADVSDETQASQRELARMYIRSKIKKDRFRAEDNVNSSKMKRLGRIIQTYLMGKHVSDETDWQFDVATVLIDRETKKAKINLIEGLIL